jgi:hypothetical protein
MKKGIIRKELNLGLSVWISSKWL